MLAVNQQTAALQFGRNGAIAVVRHLQRDAFNCPAQLSLSQIRVGRGYHAAALTIKTRARNPDRRAEHFNGAGTVGRLAGYLADELGHAAIPSALFDYVSSSSFW